MSHDDDNSCDVCGKPMIEGQQFYAGIRHWDCQYPDGYKSTADVLDDFNRAVKKVEDALVNLGNRYQEKRRGPR